ncbi:hypothetical protein SAMN04487948_104291 [Halogranum amylolyticum]|uniref:ZIP Zinc transporter n=1 Tax=Halogranum amylolyticum TaxID=660520 RepID=A0A1H8RWZ8_9EURY|nr:hypothetical protein [Halogranum amylolyticum]SEO70882.1 hypothetical protein SAMN04487948_104291 [Halogranum amylolyticum]
MESAPLYFAVGLALVHLFVPLLRPTALVSTRQWLSFAGGVSAAYVFVHLLPALRAGQRTLADVGPVESFLDHHAYLVALAGFVVFYGLENLAQRSSGDDGDGTNTETSGVFQLHVGTFSVYSGLVGYLLVHRIDDGLRSVAVFAVAMALHFFVVDAGFRRHHADAYHRRGRWILALAVLCGWGVAQLFALAEPSLAVLEAFLAGGIVLNVTKEEIPAERQSAFPSFVVGAVCYATLLLGA